jgi:hypothetical protein
VEQQGCALPSIFNMALLRNTLPSKCTSNAGTMTINNKGDPNSDKPHSQAVRTSRATLLLTQNSKQLSTAVAGDGVRQRSSVLHAHLVRQDVPTGVAVPGCGIEASVRAVCVKALQVAIRWDGVIVSQL